MPIEAGQLWALFRFERRKLDANGDRLGDWGDDAITLPAKFAPLKMTVRGGEAVMSERLQGRQPVILTVRDCAGARLIASDWRAVNERSGEIYGVKGASMNGDNIAFIDILVQAEGTDG
jgi:hypothetical protein